MSPLFLLLTFLSLVLALPVPVSRQLGQDDVDCSGGNDCISRVFLKQGLATARVIALFNLTGTEFEKASDPVYEILDGKDIITEVEFERPTPPDSDHNNIVYSAKVSFNRFPGRANMRIFIIDSKGTKHTSTHRFEVMGLVLYEMQGDQPHILTGLNPNRTVVRAQNGGGFGTTVNVRFFQGDPTSTPADPQDIRLIVDRHSNVLPWNVDDCPIVADPNSLGARCSMGFSLAFNQFFVRIPPGREIPAEIPVQFEWVGIRAYEERIVGESGIAGVEQPISLDSDVITSIIITERASPDDRDNAAAPLAGWKIGVIAITSVLLVLAAITLVCCYFCGRKRSPKKPEPDVVGFKDKFQEIGFLRRSTLRRGGDDDGDDNDQCYVEEPPSPEGSEILMLENESRDHGRSGEGHIEGLIPIDRLNEDKSVERLVLPPGVVRGVELESSTEGASAFGYGSQSGENDATSYGRGMTSVPRDQFTKPREYRSSQDRSPVVSRRSDPERGRDPDYFRDSHERIRSLERDRARIREVDREIERERSVRDRSEERMGPRLSEEEFPNSGPVIDDRTNGVGSRSRGGVGAAINRIRQLDLLNGPASRGLVGRNGEPIQEADGEVRSGGNVIEVSGSALS